MRYRRAKDIIREMQLGQVPEAKVLNVLDSVIESAFECAAKGMTAKEFVDVNRKKHEKD